MNRSVNTQRGKQRQGNLPRGVGSMAFTELWERFSFYGLQGILSFYLLYSLADGGLEVDPASASGIVGAYGGAVYLAQLLGAWLGDRLISPKYMVLHGALIITAGHIALAITAGLAGLAIGLILIVLGTGALKTNITSIVGFVVEDNPEEKRDVSFSYFYMAINAGAVLGPLSTGWVQNEHGFHWGFGLAAIGMSAALIVYIASMHKLPSKASIVNNPLNRSKYLTVTVVAVIAVAIVIALFASGALLPKDLSTATTVLSLIAAGAYFATMGLSSQVSPPEKRRVFAFFPLFLVSGIYFGLLFQKFTAISVLIKERVDLSIGDWSFPVAWITTVSPLSAVLITPVIAALWNKLGPKQPSPPAKFAIGMIQIGCAYLFMLAIASMTGDAFIPLALILLFMMLAGSSEVFVGPIGLALATKIGPKNFQAQMVGLNFLTLALGSSLSGLLGQLFTTIPSEQYFIIIASTGICLGALILIFQNPLTSNLYQGIDR